MLTVEELTHKVADKVAEYSKRKSQWDISNRVTILVALAAAWAATVFGLLNVAYVAGALSALGASALTAQRAFAISSRARFYDRFRNEFEVLGNDLGLVPAGDEEQLRACLTRYNTILTDATNSKPTADWDARSSSSQP